HAIRPRDAEAASVGIHTGHANVRQADQHTFIVFGGGLRLSRVADERAGFRDSDDDRGWNRRRSLLHHVRDVDDLGLAVDLLRLADDEVAPPRNQTTRRYRDA